MTFVSYAQNFEDVLLRRALARVGHGFYVDVGAQDPVRDSVTKAFYEMGWHGINIEPVPRWFEKISQDRSRDTNLRVVACDADGEVIFYEVEGSGLSTLSQACAEGYRQQGFQVVEHLVPMRRLSGLLDEHAEGDIHFLKIDVEGAEASVIAGIDFERHRPWILVVEARLPNSTTDAYDAWEGRLLAAGYVFAWDDGLNRFYYAKEHAWLAEHFRFPPNVFDDFVSYASVLAETAAQAERDSLKHWATELEERLSHAEISVARHSKEASAQVRTLQHDVDTVTEALRQSQASEAAIAAERDALREWAQSLERQLREATARVTELEERLLQSEATMARYSEEASAQVQTLQHDVDVATEALRQSQASEAAIAADRDALREWTQSLERQLHEVVSQADERLKACSEQLAARDSAIMLLQGEIHDLDARCEQLLTQARSHQSIVERK